MKQNEIIFDSSPLLISPPAASGQLRGETYFYLVSKEIIEPHPTFIQR
jgi:hypothetical protein